MAKEIYLCTLYEPGDKVREKYGSDEIKEIESVDFKYVGIYPTQFLKFKGRDANICDLSNFYIPAAETIEKYKDGLKYYNEVKVLRQKKSNSKEPSDKAQERLVKALRRTENKTLNDEDTKPVYRTFGNPPIKKKDDGK